MQSRLRWGILGTGGIARQLAQALAELDDALLYGVASRDAAKAAAFAGEFGAPSHYGSYADLLADPQIDVVYIATPHAQHHALLLDCIAAGKPVLCEKPFTLNARQGAEAIALARARGVFVMEAMWTRFIPAIVAAQDLVAAGEIGRLQSLQADFGFCQPFDAQHRTFNPALGGGALLDIGIYPLALAQLFLGPISAISAQAELGQSGVDEQTSFSLRHRDGGISQGLCSLRSRTPWEATLMGERGTLRLHSPMFKPERLTVHNEQGSREIAVPHLGNGYRYEVEEVNRCLRAGLRESPRMPLDDTLAALAAMDEIRRQIGVRYPGE